MNLTLYDRTGRPNAYVNDGTHLYLFNGKPVAYLHRGSLYAYSGKHLGWFENGWIIDHVGYCAFFTEIASGGPSKPVKHVKPVKGVKNIRPIKNIRQFKPSKPAKKSSWSTLSGPHFFE